MSNSSFAVRPCAWLTLWRVFRHLRITADDVILDVGSGVGRAVLVASLFPFRRIIGLEISEPMHQQAGANLASFRQGHHSPIELVLGDATTYELPDDVTVIFMYNPFAGQVFRLWLTRLIASLDRKPRRVRLGYVNPVEHDCLMSTGRCNFVGQFRGLRPTREWARTVSTHFYDLD
jgi:SAM-dependent methyltransferase